MEVLYFLEGLRTPLMDKLMLAVTTLGEETAFLVAALIVFWCVDKRKGYYIMAVGFTGTMLNQFLKLMCQVPRPWVVDPEFTIVEQAREAAAGYSWPSGHSQNAVGTFGSLACMTQMPWLKGLFIAVAVLVPVSRMYLGVHTPFDVFMGGFLALTMVWVLKPLAWRATHQGMKDVIGMMLVMAVGLLAFSVWFPTFMDVDKENALSCMKNGCTMLGSILGVAVVYLTERKYVKFEEKAVWWAQILKVVLGFGLVLLVKEGLRSPLEMVLNVYAARAVRYFLIVIMAGVVWPMSFQYFSKLGVKK